MSKATSWAGAALSIFVCGQLFAADSSSNSESAAPLTQFSTAQPESPAIGVARPQLVEAAARIEERIDLISKKGLASKAVVIHEPEASFIKVHFERFVIPHGVVVTVRNPEGTEAYEYTSSRKGSHTLNRRDGDDGRHSFSAMSITGDTAVIEIDGKARQINGLKHQVSIDYYMRGYSDRELRSGQDQLASISTTQASAKGNKSVLESTCGVNERYDVACWEGSHPEEFDSSWPVAKLLMNGSSLCTAWRVGPDNRMFTNNHCVANQADVESLEIWFDYQKISCGYSELANVVKVTGGQLLATDWYLDYTLFTVSDFAVIAEFGYLGLDIEEVGLGDQIYIPQHGLGYPKQIAIESDMNADGSCQVDDPHHDGRDEGSDIGYYCDTTGGSSGSPVISSTSHRVVALHHYGGCLNSGVKMSRIWTQVSGFFGGVVPGGDVGPPPADVPPTASFTFQCSGLTCDFDGTASADTDGNLESWSWDLGDGGTATGTAVSHQYAAEGSYWVMLTVTDNSGLSDTQLHQVVVNLPNQPPVAAFAISCNGLDCAFDASASSDSDGQLATYAWNFGDGAATQSGEPVASHTFPAGGSYQVSLTVTDDEGASASANSTIEVAEPVSNQLPEAQYTYACTELSCTFDASASVDPDGTIVSYVWHFGDGESSESGGPVKSYSYVAAGQYSVTLEVEDNMGARSSETLTVDVSPAKPEPPPSATVELTVTGVKYRGSKWAELSWTGTTGSEVDIFRDGQLLETVTDDGSYTDDTVENKSKSAIYRVCVAASSECSGDKVAFF